MTSIGQTIKKLRKERKMTQEELAARLNISAQAVSKWEMETTSPDISQVIPLATLFGVSTDVLFGIRPDGMEQEIEEARQYCARPDTSNAEALEVWTELYQRYPHNNHIRFELATTYTYLASNERENPLAYFRTAADYYEKILDDSTDHVLRNQTIYHLHHVYNTLGDREQVLRIANMGGDWGTLRAEMLSKINGYEEKNRWCQDVFRYDGEGAAWALIGMHFSNTDDQIRAYETAEKILDLVYCDGDRAWIAYVYVTLYKELACLYAARGEEEMVYAILDKWYATAEAEDNLPLGVHRYVTNPFLNEIVYNRDLAYTHAERDLILYWLGDKAFDRLRDTDRFRAYVDRVTAMPGIEHPFGGVNYE